MRPFRTLEKSEVLFLLTFKTHKMNILDIITILVFLFIPIYLWIIINPKLDWNYETGERLLWYNDPFDLYFRSRKSIVLYRKKE